MTMDIYLLVAMMPSAVWAVCEIEASPHWTVKVTWPGSHNTKQLGNKPSLSLSRNSWSRVSENRHVVVKGLKCSGPEQFPSFFQNRFHVLHIIILSFVKKRIIIFLEFALIQVLIVLSYF